jgi:5-oxoprolinase (ATP-hydrolysing)
MFVLVYTKMDFAFSIDRGGTFTDIYYEFSVQSESGQERRSGVGKLLSVDPANYRDAPTEGIRRILEEHTGISIPRNTPIPTSYISSIRMGTTVATNALLERKGERIAFVCTKGFADILEIGN